MNCERWKESLVSRLYDETTAEEASRLDEHLAVCPGCREDLARLEQARGMLATAIPEVPVTPRVVVLTPGASRRAPWLSFAAGFAAAALLLGAGLVGGYAWAVRTGVLADGAGPAEPLAADTTRTALPQTQNVNYVTVPEFDRLRQEVDRYGGQLHQITAGMPRQVLTPEEFQARLAAYREQVERERAAEIAWLLEEMAGVEMRTGARIGQTQDTLNDLLVLASDDSALPH